MAPRPPVFISYKRSDPTTARLMDRLLARLAPRFDLRVDWRFLNPGVIWRQRIFTEIHAARAAIVLLSEAALADSEWVPVEATAIGARRLADPGFLVLPVRLDGLRSEVLREAPFSTVAFHELQGLTAPAAADDAALDQLASDIDTALAGLAAAWPQTPMEGLELYLAEKLRPVAEARAVAVLDRLGAAEDPPPADVHRALARALLAPRDLPSWRLAFQDLVPWLKRDAEDVLVRALPLVWVPGSTASAAVDGGRWRPAVCTRAAYADLTPRDVLAAARPSEQRVVPDLLADPAGEDIGADLEHQLRVLLGQRYTRPGRPAMSPDRQRELLRERASEGDPMLVVVRVPSAGLAASLVAAWPEICFFVLSEDTGAAGALHLLPDLPAGAEDDADDTYERMRERIRKESA
jgi:hypothetical protein